jgi:hypothetical protein
MFSLNAEGYRHGCVSGVCNVHGEIEKSVKNELEIQKTSQRHEPACKVKSKVIPITGRGGL